MLAILQISDMLAILQEHFIYIIVYVMSCGKTQWIVHDVVMRKILNIDGDRWRQKHQFVHPNNPWD